jgi:hypothetical protein
MKIMEMKKKRLSVIHFKNPRTGRTICGKNYKIPKRKVTSRFSKVSCSGCLNSIKSLQWVKKMIELENKTSKNHQEISEAVVEKSREK